MNVIGVDGCRGGWFAVALESGRNWTLNVYKSIDELWQALSRVRESHPELCLWALAGEQIMDHSKKTAQGFAERYSILQKHYL